jgi:hypothetical protein
MTQKFDMSGALFKNDLTGKSENFPPYGGSVTIDGVDYWVSAWLKEGAKGKFFSLAFKPKEPRGNTDAQRDNYSQNYRPSEGGGFGGGGPEADDIPFMSEWRV